jgi:LPXTG-site transpeptidase (sortase) family protein
MTHRPYLERAAHVLAAISLGVGLLAAVPMAEAFRSTPALRPQPAKAAALGSFASGDLVARVSLDRLGIDAPVFEGVDGAGDTRGAFHLSGTPLPGDDAERNDSLVAVPRDSPAARISQARVGDAVTMRTPFGMREYRVVERRVVRPQAVRLSRGRRPRILLVTPYPADTPGPAPLRLAVVLEGKRSRI